MDLYNLQESDHKLIEQTLGNIAVNVSEYQEYLKRHFFNFERVLNKKAILVAEEDPRIQKAMTDMIREANQEAQCWAVDSVDEIDSSLELKSCDLLIANYYLSEDEIDYEYWERVRARYPHMEVIILSHINDREYYDMLEKTSGYGARSSHPLSSRIRHFFENVFGG
ncbi:hypothetical protein [Bdellovibrio sp. HCB337]|uniref:hypothetical protein n=1 Tax=Bdellovibrio sp. HCB337 TaxID=3394358 RepID=UPI0039A6A10A